MKSIGWKNIAESVGVIAIVASLLFVGLQLQQDKRLTRAELGSFAMEYSSSVSFGLSDPEVAHVWAKMLDNPEDLSSAEMVQIGGILRSVRTIMLRECYLLAMDVFGECESTVRAAAKTYFSNEFAQAWWRNYHDQNPYGTGDFINDIVTSVDITGNRSFQEKVQSEL